MQLKNIFLILFIAAFIINKECYTFYWSKKSYKGYKVYLVKGNSNTQRNIILDLSKNINYDFFQLPSYVRREAVVLIGPENQKSFEAALISYGIKFHIINGDVESSWQIRTETKTNHTNYKNVVSNIYKPTDHYMTYEEINKFLDLLAAAYPKKINITVVGKSYEQLDIKIVTIASNKKNATIDRNMIMIESGTHAREWIPIATALLFIYNLVVRESEIYDLLHYEWLIMPLVNPDGYKYSHTVDRLWLKTRQPINQTNCFGVDINRNFDYAWGGEEFTSNPCHSHYRGSFPFSEMESKVLRDVILRYKNRIKMYLSLHSFGSYILHPWAHTSEEPKDIFYMNEIAWEGANAIQVYSGHAYTIGSAAWKRFNYTGTSFDYAYAKARIPFVFMVLSAGNGSVVYNPPESDIHKLAEEIWIGTKSMIRHLSEDRWERKVNYAEKYSPTWPLIIPITISLYSIYFC